MLSSILVADPGGTGPRVNVRSLAIDKDDGFYIGGDYVLKAVVGDTTIRKDPHALSTQAYWAHFNADGSFNWFRDYGRSNEDAITEIVLSNTDSPIVAGYFFDEVVFDKSRLSSTTGSHGFLSSTHGLHGTEWAKIGPSSAVAAPSLALDANGSIYLTTTSGGDQYEHVELQRDGPYSIFVGKYASDGTLLWAQSAAGPDRDHPYDVAVSTNGYVFAAGQFERFIDFGTGRLVSGGERAETNPTEGYGDSDGFIAVYTPDGEPMQAWSFGGTGNDRAYGLALDPASNTLYVRGIYEQTASFGDTTLTGTVEPRYFIAKYRLGDSIPTDLKQPRVEGHSEIAIVYPNPFTTHATIRLFLAPETTRSTSRLIKIYDVLGRLVAVIDISHLGPGWHTVRLDPSQFFGAVPSGAYFARLQVGNEIVSTQRLHYVR
ncbi:MAG: hypothetical protein RhofKO_31190 [Rhodothermales bacterium]